MIIYVNGYIMGEKVNIRSIAKEAGVSIATVSRVMNGFEYVDETTREKVLKIIRKYDYTPHFFGRGLSKQQSDSIGLITPLHFSPSSFYFTEIFSGLVDVVGRENFSVIVPPYSSQDYLKLFIENRIDAALFIAPPVDDQNIRILTEKGMPFVVVNSYVSGVKRVDIDNKKAMLKLLNHVWELGHRDIGIIAGYMKSPNAAARLEAYREFLDDKKCDINKDWILVGDFALEKAYKQAKKLFSSKGAKPTAILACNDSMALGAMKALNELGIDIPGEVSVTGFDDIDTAAHISPPLTTVRQPFSEMGRVAGRMLMDMLAKKDIEDIVLLEAELVKRESTDAVSGMEENWISESG